MSPRRRAPVTAPVPDLLALGLSVLGAIVFVCLSVSRHVAFQSHAFDLGNMDQAVWNTLQGRPLRFTDMQVGRAVLTTRLAIHVEPILFPISLLYLIAGAPETLLVLQGVVVAAGAIPAYLLARDVLGSSWPALAFPLAYLLHPSLQNAVLDDFHAVTLSATFLMWALLYAWRDRAVPFLLWGILAASTKEEVGLAVAALGLLFLVRHRWRVALPVALGGVGWFLVSVMLIVPANNPAGHSPYLDRYAYLGHGIGGILGGIARRPALVAATLLSVPRLTYFLGLVHPLGLVSLLGLPVLLTALPALLINALSADPSMYSGFYQYSVEIVPAVVGSAAIGIARLSDAMRRRKVRGARFARSILLALTLVAAVVDSWRFGFTPLARGYVIPGAGPHQRLERQLLALIPPRAVVAAADEMEPHLSQRRWVYLLPTLHPSNGPRAGWVALDASIAGLPATPRRLRQVAVGALDRGYGIVAAADGILILRRGAPGRTLPPAFFSFLYDQSPAADALRVRAGGLELVGATVHPRNRFINRSRPAIGIDTDWKVVGRIAPGTRIVFSLSPVYTGRIAPSRPAVTSADSPAWDWLPLSRWPRGRVVHAASIPLLTAPYRSGYVDARVAIVRGTMGSTGESRIRATTVRLATVRVEW